MRLSIVAAAALLAAAPVLEVGPNEQAIATTATRIQNACFRGATVAPAAASSSTSGPT